MFGRKSLNDVRQVSAATSQAVATAIAEEMDMLGLEEAAGDERTPDERPANAHMKQAKSHN